MSVDAVRPPDERFAGLPGYPWEPHYLERDGLRLARVDEGEGPAVVLFHGEPTWSYLWRKVMPPLLDAGYRCVAPDLPGFGRSDKPTDLGWYSYDRHVEIAAWMLEQAAVRDATFVVHDWGGLIGLRLVAAAPDRFARVVVGNTGLPTGERPPNDAFLAWQKFAREAEQFPVGRIISNGCTSTLDPAVVAAYDAPFPTPASKAGARAFPLMLPTSPDDPGAAAGQAAADGIAARRLPSLCLWADSDPIIPLATGHAVAGRLNLSPPETIANASHFLQEDQGEQIGERIAAWLGEQRS